MIISNVDHAKWFIRIFTTFRTRSFARSLIRAIHLRFSNRTRSPRACLRPRRKHLGLGTKTQLADKPSRASLSLEDILEIARTRVNPRLILGNAEGGIDRYRGMSSFMHPAREDDRRRSVACIWTRGESRNWEEPRISLATAS